MYVLVQVEAGARLNTTSHLAQIPAHLMGDMRLLRQPPLSVSLGLLFSLTWLCPPLPPSGKLVAHDVE